MPSPGSDRAVNPVIGTVLLVALVIVLSSAISVFVLGLGSELTEPAQGSVDVEVTDEGNGTVTVTATGLQRADRIDVRAQAIDGELWDGESGETDDLEASLERIAETTSFEAAGGDTEVRIVAIAVSDGGEAIVYDDTHEL